jgi:hypothetical protein
MRVRVPNLLGKDVHEASMIDVPDELSETGSKTVIAVTRDGDDPLHMDWSAADEIELVDATDDERAAHAQMLEIQKKFL